MRLLRFFYNGLLTGMPSIVYNPYTKNNIHVPFTVAPKSLYVNYKLNDYQVETIQSHLETNNCHFKMIPVQMENNHPADYYVSLNIYNCTSPVFMNDKQTTRFEINTYITNGEKDGTLILDYISNELSVDPIDIFKSGSNVVYNSSTIYANSNDKHIYLYGDIKKSPKDSHATIINDLVEYSDNIFYMNGIYDKLFYDTTLTKAVLKKPYLHNLSFFFLNTSFKNPTSYFYFDNQIDFVGGMWYNIYETFKLDDCPIE